MYAVIEKSLGGLTLPYYLRHLCFALIFPLMLFAQVNHQPGSGGMFLLAVVNTLLYPYARFLYERVWGFIMGIPSSCWAFSGCRWGSSPP